MKKILLFVLALSMVILVACGGSGSTDAETKEETEEDLTEESIIASEEDVEENEPDPITSYEITYQNYYLYEDYSGDVNDYVIVQVKNTGTTDIYLDDATFSFMDADGNLVGVDSGLISEDPDVVAPGEYGYFYHNMGSVGGDMDVNGDYILVPELSIKESTIDPIQYDITNTSLSSGDFGPVEVIGQITNTTDETVDDVSRYEVYAFKTQYQF